MNIKEIRNRAFADELKKLAYETENQRFKRRLLATSGALGGAAIGSGVGSIAGLLGGIAIGARAMNRGGKHAASLFGAASLPLIGGLAGIAGGGIGGWKLVSDVVKKDHESDNARLSTGQI